MTGRRVLQSIFVVLLAAGAAGIYLAIQQGVEQNRIAQREKDTILYQAAVQLNEQFESTFDKTGKLNPVQVGAYLRVQQELADFVQRDPAATNAADLLKKYRERTGAILKEQDRLKREAIANDVQGRRSFANMLDVHMLKAGTDMRVSLSGPKDTVMEIRYPLFNRASVFQLQETRFFQNAWDAGFKKIILVDGYTYSTMRWSFDAPKSE